MFWLEMLQERDDLENTFMNERIILKWFLNKYEHGRRMFIRSEQEQEYFFVENVLNFLVPSNARRILTS